MGTCRCVFSQDGFLRVLLSLWCRFRCLVSFSERAVICSENEASALRPPPPPWEPSSLLALDVISLTFCSCSHVAFSSAASTPPSSPVRSGRLLRVDLWPRAGAVPKSAPCPTPQSLCPSVSLEPVSLCLRGACVPCLRGACVPLSPWSLCPSVSVAVFSKATCWFLSLYWCENNTRSNQARCSSKSSVMGSSVSLSLQGTPVLSPVAGWLQARHPPVFSARDWNPEGSAVCSVSTAPRVA